MSSLDGDYAGRHPVRHDRSNPDKGHSTDPKPKTSIRDGSISHKPTQPSNKE